MINRFIDQYEKHLIKLRWLINPFFFGQHATFVELLVRYYGRQMNKVLDVGARRSPYTRSINGLVIGLDLPADSESKLGFTPDNLKKLKERNFYPIIGNVEEIPFKENCFDLVLMIEVIEHIEDDQRALLNILKIIKPGGMLILTTPNGETFPKPSKHHIRHYNPITLKNLISTHFQIIHFWCLFPKGRLWNESVRSFRSILKNHGNIINHFLLIQIYWFVTLYYFFLKKTQDTTTIIVVAKKY